MYCHIFLWFTVYSEDQPDNSKVNKIPWKSTTRSSATAEIVRVGGHYAVHGHSRSLEVLVPSESPYMISAFWNSAVPTTHFKNLELKYMIKVQFTTTFKSLGAVFLLNVFFRLFSVHLVLCDSETSRYDACYNGLYALIYSSEPASHQPTSVPRRFCLKIAPAPTRRSLLSQPNDLSAIMKAASAC